MTKRKAKLETLGLSREVTIRSEVQNAIAQARRHDAAVMFNFRDISVVVTKRSKVDAVVANFKTRFAKKNKLVQEALDKLKHSIIAADPVPNQAIPPVEVGEALKKFHLPPDAIQGWYATPSKDAPLKRVAIKDFIPVDAVEALKPLLDSPELQKTLTTLDVLNGCRHHCDTCLVDSVWPSKMFTYESLESLFKDPRFLAMLRPSSLRIGSSGDILDHPRGIDIIKMILKETEAISPNYKIKVLTNYRHKREGQIDELLELARLNPERLDVTLSLPFNRNDFSNEKFEDYYDQNLKLQDLLNKNVHIHDVRHRPFLFTCGRVISAEVNANRVEKYNFISQEDRTGEFAYRGFVKTHLNADCLWLKVYATPYESHTNNVYTPITSRNIHALSSLPYHPDFETPPNWPGGKGIKRSSSEVKRMIQEAKSSSSFKSCTVVKSFPRKISGCSCRKEQKIKTS